MIKNLSKKNSFIVKNKILISFFNKLFRNNLSSYWFLCFDILMINLNTIFFKILKQ